MLKQDQQDYVPAYSILQFENVSIIIKRNFILFLQLLLQKLIDLLKLRSCQVEVITIANLLQY